MTEEPESYALHDFYYALLGASSAGIDVDWQKIETVEAAWGTGSPEWMGGFLVRMKDFRMIYIEGWTDYTGWGCQDGVAAVVMEWDDYRATAPVSPFGWQTQEEPSEYGYTGRPPYEKWGKKPVDLNLMVEKVQAGADPSEIMYAR